MYVERALMQTDENGQPLSMPRLPPRSWIEAIFLILDRAPSAGAGKQLNPLSLLEDELRRQVVSPVPDDEWDVAL